MMQDGSRLSRSVEDYLKAVFELDSRGESASTSSLAEVLQVQPSSVTGMVKRLAEWGLLAHVPYRGVHLTPSGRREALRVLRRHRVLETYLTDRLGFSWEDVHDEAEQLEHAVSDRLIDAMAHALGDPSHDPHGAPIPTSEGQIEAASFVTLAESAPGVQLSIHAVDDKGSDELRAMEALGLAPGVPVRVLDELPGGARLAIAVGAEEDRREIASELAALVYVTPVG